MKGVCHFPILSSLNNASYKIFCDKPFCELSSRCVKNYIVLFNFIHTFTVSKLLFKNTIIKNLYKKKNCIVFLPVRINRVKNSKTIFLIHSKQKLLIYNSLFKWTTLKARVRLYVKLYYKKQNGVYYIIIIISYIVNIIIKK